MKYQILFSGKNKTKISSICPLPNLHMPSVNTNALTEHFKKKKKKKLSSKSTELVNLPGLPNPPYLLMKSKNAERI